MADLEAKLKEASGARVKMIATDGCFSMDGTIADLGAIVELAEKYNAHHDDRRRACDRLPRENRARHA